MADAGGDVLIRQLADQLRHVLRPNSVIVCVGNELRGDDGAGVIVGRRLAGRTPWKAINAQTVPENYLMTIADAAPDSILFIDALHFNAEPGTVRLFSGDDLQGLGPSTHGPSPQAFLIALRMLHTCNQAVLGIQPDCLDLDTGLTPPVASATDQIIRAFELLSPKGG